MCSVIIFYLNCVAVLLCLANCSDLLEEKSGKYGNVKIGIFLWLSDAASNCQSSHWQCLSPFPGTYCAEIFMYTINSRRSTAVYIFDMKKIHIYQNKPLYLGPRSKYLVIDVSI